MSGFEVPLLLALSFVEEALYIVLAYIMVDQTMVSLTEMHPIRPWVAKKAAPSGVLGMGLFAGEVDARLMANVAHAVVLPDSGAKCVAVADAKEGYTPIHALLHAHIVVQHSQLGPAPVYDAEVEYLVQCAEDWPVLLPLVLVIEHGNRCENVAEQNQLPDQSPSKSSALAAQELADR